MQPAKIPVFILAGGLGSRLSEETQLKPKPIIEIGGIPILVHIMRHYYNHGFDDFVICAGYKSWEIKQFFLEYQSRCNHIEIDHRKSFLGDPRPVGKNVAQEKWRVRVVDTGTSAMTGARIARAFDLVTEMEPIEHFAATYGDGLSDHCLTTELKFHLSHSCVGTVLGVSPTARFGELETNSAGQVTAFREKPATGQNRINGGFFFFRKEIRSYIEVSESCVLEKNPLEKLAQNQQLKVYQHDGFWHPMDTLRDKNYLQSLWDSGKAPWVSSQMSATSLGGAAQRADQLGKN